VRVDSPTPPLLSLAVALFALSQAAFYYAFKYIISSMDPLKTKKKDAHEKSAKVLDRLGVRMIACVHIFSVGTLVFV